jgi:hypothetical protein
MRIDKVARVRALQGAATTHGEWVAASLAIARLTKVARAYSLGTDSRNGQALDTRV